MAPKLDALIGELMTQESKAQMEPELVAMSAVHAALKELEPEVQMRVLSWVASKLKIRWSPVESAMGRRDEHENDEPEVSTGDTREDANGILDGISAVARKWIARNGIEPEKLSTLFSLGGEEVDLIAKSVPGKNKKERMHSVFLLKGIAAYLGAGVARFTHEQMKEACLHYDAFDAANFALYFRGLAGEVTGGKSGGYALTPRGMANATEIVKGMTSP